MGHWAHAPNAPGQGARSSTCKKHMHHALDSGPRRPARVRTLLSAMAGAAIPPMWHGGQKHSSQKPPQAHAQSMRKATSPQEDWP
eukprot:4319724-Alexandrium_andersonii.AAC.1